MLYILLAGSLTVCPWADSETRTTSVLRNSISPSYEADRIDRNVALIDRYGSRRSSIRTLANNFVCPCETGTFGQRRNRVISNKSGFSTEVQNRVVG
jgi:hypothetical protein